MSGWTWAGFAVAAGAGACLRYLADTWLQNVTDGVFPFGTLAVNITGSFLFGVISEAALRHVVGASLATIVGTGFCGAYTTFSTFTFETVQLAEEGALWEAAVNVGASIAGGLAAAAAGMALGAVV